MATTKTSARRATAAAALTGYSASLGGRADHPPPEIPDMHNGMLDPGLPRTIVKVPNYAGKAVGDQVGLVWDAPESGKYTDSFPISEPSLNDPVEFRVQGTQIRPNEGRAVLVHFTVSRGGVIVETSDVVSVPIGEQIPEPGDVEPPAIEGVAGGVLNLADVPDSGAIATVAPYAGMAVGQIVFIDINDSDWEAFVIISNAGQVGQPVSFTIPKSALQKYSGTTITLGTVVTGHENGTIESNPLQVRVLEPVGELPLVSVPGAIGNSLLPEDIVGDFVEVVVAPYPGIAEGDKITFRWVNASGTPAPFQQEVTVSGTPQRDYVFEVPRNHADLNKEKSASLSYIVTRGTTQSQSEAFVLWIGEAFEAPLTVDLSRFRYIVGEKPPVAVPDYAQFKREAKFGTAPYNYVSADESVASIDSAGVVTPMGNGAAQISATDSRNETRSFTITVSGLKTIYFVSPSANFAGAAAACAAAGLDVPTVDDLKAFWVTYFPSSGPVAQYMDWLSYPFWTGTAIGAGTAYAYDLNGPDEQQNVKGRNEADYLQVVGVTPSSANT
ncbi:hypothetical protein [Pandoraea sputorum]|uniref:BIG2 domain-containing protein n=1 Tax=Pandoraea sputorum TaxID=93222 RepID=A0A5E5B2E1_9BURK|nr:hypothetical protein [Pandoraea sputorum]VVE80059.1 hypothetical protein PSP31121_02474 [Pandoraea sputorum]